MVASQSDLFGYPEIVQLADQQDVSLDVHTAHNTKDADYNDGLEKTSELIRREQLVHDGNPVLRILYGQSSDKNETKWRDGC